MKQSKVDVLMQAVARLSALSVSIIWCSGLCPFHIILCRESKQSTSFSCSSG